MKAVFSNVKGWQKYQTITSEHGYLVHTLASRPGVPGSNPIAAPKPCEVYPSTSGLLTFKKSETVLWSIAKYYLFIINELGLKSCGSLVKNV